MDLIPGLLAGTTCSVRRNQAKEQDENYGQLTHGHGGNPLKILGAETYLDGNTLSIAQSLTELAQQPPRDMYMGWRFNENNNASGTATPPILKARQADDNLNIYSQRGKSSGPLAKEKAKPKEKSHEPEETPITKRKRKRRASEEDDGEHETEKKARGRPRLDTKDESAADRRRTQIRMAQRAYRNRKETTIASLEKQVEELRSMTGQMNSAFIDLYDVAVTKGLLQKEPEFGRHLQSTVQRFLALAKTFSANESINQEPSISPLGPSALPIPQDQSGPNQRNVRQDSHRPSSQDGLNRGLTTHSVWGYEVTLPAQVSQQPANTNYATHTQQWLEELPPPPQPEEDQIEILARATEANASFSFDMYHNDNNGNTTNTNRAFHSNYMASFAEIQMQQPIIQFGSPFNPYIQPPLPPTYSHNEPTLGRRLHRIIVERGYRLLLNPHLAPQTYQRVFGLTLRLYPKEMLAEALKRTIDRHKREPLSRWELPFTNLGGSGTYFPTPAEEEQAMPKTGTGRSIGPLIEVVSENHEKYMMDNFRATAVGYEGIWFDTYDVEAYLRKRGIEVPSDAEYVTIDLDKLNPSEVTMAATTVSPVNSMASSGGISLASSSPLNSHGTTATPSSPQTPYVNVFGLQQRHQISMPADKTLEYFLAGAGNQATVNAETSEMQSNDLTWMLGPGDFTNSLNGTGLEGQRLVVVSVKKLMEFILRKGICLGRAPGFRPRDIDRALRQTIIDAGQNGEGGYAQFASEQNT